MTDQEPQTVPAAPTVNAPIESTFVAPADSRPQRGGGRGRNDKNGRRPPNRGRRDDKPRSEFDQKIIQLRRVSRVVAGGRRFSFSAAVVAGDRKGRVGIGIGKGADTALAVDKAFRDAKRRMFRVRTTSTMSIPHDVIAKNSSGIVEIRPAPERGIVAGSSVKTVMELAGIKDITAKIHSGSKNKLNIARATIDALAKLKK
jgi:small subunit ribosomal protein S5